MAIALGGQAAGRRQGDAPEMVLGGYTALAESAWMGAAQASDVLESLRATPAGRTRRPVLPRFPRLRLAGLLTREFSIAEATFILMASFLVSAVLGAVRQILFNAAFGAGSEASAYYAAFRLPDTLFSLIAGGALSSAMIPVLLRTIQEDGAEAGWRLISLILSALLAVFALVVVIGELFTPLFVSYLLAPGFDAETSRLTVALTRVMLLQPLILAVGSVATAVLNSRNQFLLTALSVASHNVALIAGILAARLFPGLGILGPTLGVVGGAILQVLILLPGLLGRRPDERAGSARLRLAFNLADRRLREVTRLLIPNGLSVGVNYAGFILDTAFASKAAELAGLPAIQNAWLLIGLPIALLGQAVGQSSFPRLAAHAAAAEWRQMSRTLLRSLGAVVALALPALLGLIFLGRTIIDILFVRGKFDAAAGALTYQVLVAYAVGLPFYVATEVITRGLIALDDTRTPLLTNTAQIAGRALLLTLLIAPIGVLAIPIAFAITASLETLLLGTVLLIKLRRLAR
jgi:putative peptidoglycan lipid II flippase